MKKFFVLFAFLLALGFAQAAVISEQSFQQLNLSPLTAEGANNQVCQDYSIPGTPSQDANQYTILSLHAKFSPTSEGKAAVQVSWNNPEFTILSIDDFYNSEWAHITIPKENVKAVNSVHVCATPSNSISKIEILNDSKLGTYYAPQFTFTKTTENSAPLVGKEVKITLEAKNTGSEKAKAEIRYRSTELRIVQISRGDAEFAGTIEPGQIVTLEYYVIPKYAVQMTLPPARLFYDNVFGETVVQTSNWEDLNAQRPEFPIRALIQTDKSVYKVGDTVNVTITAANQEPTAFAQTELQVSYSAGLSGDNNGMQNLSFGERETKTTALQLKAVQAGEQTIGCQILIPETDSVGVCDSKTVNIELAPDLSFFYYGIIFILIAAIAYAFIHFRSQQA
ncbi:MAG: hypothetical protein V1847_00315 [Candidatus Diapherotrites archaeon]